MADRNSFSFDNTEVAFSYKTDRELRKSSFLFSIINSNFLTQIGVRLTPLIFKLNLPFKKMVKSTIFNQFCGGETLEDCEETIGKLSGYRVRTILDYGVEAKETEEDFDKSTDGFLRSIEFSKHNPNITFISVKLTALCRFGLLEKIHAWKDLSEKEKEEKQKYESRMLRICEAASHSNVSVMIDAEESWIQNPIDEITMKLMSQFNKERPVIYNTYQMYRVDRLDFLKKTFETARSENFILGAKLVRGAYMEKERKRAKANNYPSPIQADKKSADDDYNHAVSFCVENIDAISFCIGSHNEYSNRFGAELAAEKNIPSNHPHLHFSQLYGMSDNITFNLAHAGFNVTKYVPYGPVEDVVPYLMRRAQENTSVSGQSSRELMLLKKEIKRRKS